MHLTVLKVILIFVTNKKDARKSAYIELKGTKLNLNYP